MSYISTEPLAPLPNEATPDTLTVSAKKVPSVTVVIPENVESPITFSLDKSPIVSALIPVKYCPSP